VVLARVGDGVRRILRLGSKVTATQTAEATVGATKNVTVRLTDAEKAQVKAVAQAEGMSSAEWMAAQIRRSVRAVQIERYVEADAHTREWQAAADAESDSMLAFTDAQAA
jgi:hypothetical protein